MIPVADVVIDQSEIELVNECLRTGWVSSLGSKILDFEQRFSQYSDTQYGVAVANGTVAIHLALVVLGIGPGDEVLLPSLTFVATANAVMYTGATPVFIDSEMGTGNLDPELIEARITNKTKAIIAVHLYGHPADMNTITDIGKRYGIKVIEDAAEAHGAIYHGKKVGSLSDIGTFSFYGNKIITTGEGGMLTTNNLEYYERALFLRDHAMSKDQRYWHPEIGFNYRLTNIQAALGLGQLERIEAIIAHKRSLAMRYNRLLGNLPQLEAPIEKDGCRNVYWMYAPRLKDYSQTRRDEFMLKLRERGIDSRPFFYPLHKLPPYLHLKADCPVADHLASSGINLPSGLQLTESQQEFISETIHQLLTGM